MEKRVSNILLKLNSEDLGLVEKQDIVWKMSQDEFLMVLNSIVGLENMNRYLDRFFRGRLIMLLKPGERHTIASSDNTISNLLYVLYDEDLETGEGMDRISIWSDDQLLDVWEWQGLLTHIPKQVVELMWERNRRTGELI
jgi:hypothetical protein